jgi:O-antigen/teichoic acid export membrane protein
VFTNIVYITSAIQVPYKSIIRVSTPLIARYWKEKNIVEMQKLYQKVSSVGLLIGTTTFSSIWINRIELFSYLPQEYQPGISTFLFLMIGKVIDMICGLNGSIFSTSRKFKYDLLFSIILSFSVFGLNYWLIPVYGIVGAAFSTGFALVIYNFGRVWYVYYAFKIHPFTKQMFYILFLFLGLIVLNELIYSMIQFENKMLAMFIKTFIFLVAYLLPILIFNWEPETRAYLEKWKRKLGKKANFVD